jgi:hypothetical protein
VPYTPTPDDRSSIVIIKSIDYRGLTRTFSNRYHFEGDVPPDNAHWVTFADAIVAAEKAIYDSSIQIIEAVGNDAGSATSTNLHGNAVFTKNYTTAGTGSFSSDGRRSPGDCASLLRYSTPARSARNHPVYLFNYFHGVFQTTGDPDIISPTQKTAIGAYGTSWLGGFSDGAENHERCGPHGAVAIGRLVSDVIRHRDFPA